MNKKRIDLIATGNGSKLELQGLERVRIQFGPHHFVEVFQEDEGVKFVVGATHHGFLADASEVPSQLENVVEEIRASHPDLAVD